MSDEQLKLMFRAVLFAITLLCKVHPPTAAARVEGEQLVNDLQNEIAS